MDPLTIIVIIFLVYEATLWLAKEQPQLRILSIVGLVLTWICKRHFIINPNTIFFGTWIILLILSAIKIGRGVKIGGVSRSQ